MRGIREATLASLAAAVIVGCGDNTKVDPGLPPLEADPATLTSCTTAPPAAGASRAKRVVCADELLGGRLAAGREGDFLLENDRVRVIIRGPGDGLYLYGTTGGAIIDAAQHGREDALAEVVPLVELNTGLFDELVVTEAGDDGPAEIAVRGVARPAPLFAAALGTQPAGVVLEQRYRLEPGDIAVAVETRVYTESGAEPSTAVGLIDVLFLGGHIRPRFPGQADDASRGAFLASTGRETSYGVVLDRETSASLTLSEIVFFELLEVRTLPVDGEPIRRHWIIGDGSMSSVVDRGWELHGEVTAAISGTTAPGVDVTVRDAGGDVATIARADADGRYSAAVPLGRYDVTASAIDRDPGAAVSVELGVAGATADVTPGPRGAIEVTVTADGEPAVGRVVVSGAGGDRVVYTAADGTATIGVPPGDYTLSVSKGMEYDAFSAGALVVPDDGQVAVTAPLSRAIDTSGWISLDPHLHSEMSIDSNVPLDERLLSVAGEGVEIAVSSDHDFIVDYAAVAAELGLTGALATMSGQESSSLIIGHINAWPTPVDADRPGGGALPWYGVGPSTVFELARDGDPDRIVQVNHPRDSLGLFTAIDLDRSTLTANRTAAELGIPGAELEDFSFDAIEIGNKKTEDTFDEAFGDWLALVAAGFRITATGASDSHGDDAFAGEARTFVFVGDGADDPAIVDIDAVNAAIKAQRVVVSQGIFVTAGLVDGGGTTSLPGDLVDHAALGQATLRVSVQAPPWLPVSAVVIYERDTEIMRIPVDPGDTQAVRFSGDLTLPLDGRDTLFVVSAEAGGDGRPVMDEPEPSFANPVYVDADGDGVYEP